MRAIAGSSYYYVTYEIKSSHPTAEFEADLISYNHVAVQDVSK